MDKSIVRTSLVGLAGILSALVFTDAAQADEPKGRPSLFAVGVTAGTLGLGGEVSTLVYDSLVLRAGGSFIGLNIDKDTTDSLGAKDTLKFEGKGLFAGAMLDWHMFKSGWRLSAGAKFTNFELVETDINGKTIGNNKYSSAQVGNVRTSATFKSNAVPYIGFGYDNSHFNRDGFGLSLGFDVGALYTGGPNVKITTDKSVAGLDGDITQEADKLTNDINKYYRFYPVVMLSGKLNF